MDSAMTLVLLALASLSGLVSGQTAGSALHLYKDKLPQMPKLYGYSTTGTGELPEQAHLTIGMFQKKWKFHKLLPSTTVFVYGTSKETATFPGPTIEALQGVPLSVSWQNHLPDTHILAVDTTILTAGSPNTAGVPTVVHLHGGINAPVNDGSALAWFTANYGSKGPAWATATYTYLNVQHPGNLHYHDHALGLTRINMLAGLVGAYTIRNPDVEDRFLLPSGGDYDLNLVIADRSFYSNGSLYMNSTGVNPAAINPHWQPEFFGDAITVNGKAWPYLRVHRRKYRFRIVNSSNARYYRLSLSNGMPFVVIGSDSSYLPKPVATPTFILSPAEMFDVVIDFSKSETNSAEMTNDAPYPFPGGTTPTLLNSKVMKFVITNMRSFPDTSRIPATLATYPPAVASEATTKRYITLYENVSSTGQSTLLYINGKRFTDPVTETPKSGSTEVWKVINLTADDHPLHLHLAVFQAIEQRELVGVGVFKACMVERNDAVSCGVSAHATGRPVPVPEHEKTWKNVVKIAPETMVTVVVKFRLIDGHHETGYPFDATAEPGYVYHCHILNHEDNEMIRPLKLV